MNAAMVTNTIGLILAPAVLITTCAILLNGLHGHYTAIDNQLRMLTRERLDLLRAASTVADRLNRERLWEIDAQAPTMLRRHRLIHDAVLVLYSAVIIFLISMFVIAAATLTDRIELAMAVLLIFLAAVATMLTSMLLITREVRSSHQDVQDELQRVLTLGVADHQPEIEAGEAAVHHLENEV